jgi:hypothetical protein
MRTKTIDDAIKASHTAPAPVTVLEYQPGNGTRYHLHITDLRAALSEAPPQVNAYAGHGAWYVALYTEGNGTCMTVADNGGYLAPSYVASKLKVSDGDAAVLAEVIARYTGRTADNASATEEVA